MKNEGDWILKDIHHRGESSQRVWDCRNLAVGLFFHHIKLGEVRGIRACFSFLLIGKKNKRKAFK
jgi:hypothetical protein